MYDAKGVELQPSEGMPRDVFNECVRQAVVARALDRVKTLADHIHEGGGVSMPPGPLAPAVLDADWNA